MPPTTTLRLYGCINIFLTLNALNSVLPARIFAVYAPDFTKKFVSFAPKSVMLARQNVKNMKQNYARLVLKPAASALKRVVSAVKEIVGMSNLPMPCLIFY